MTNFSNVIQVGVSMLLIVILGYVLTKFRVVTPRDNDLINKLSQVKINENDERDQIKRNYSKSKNNN